MTVVPGLVVPRLVVPGLVIPEFVIPAQAGIQSFQLLAALSPAPAVRKTTRFHPNPDALGPRLRGDDAVGHRLLGDDAVGPRLRGDDDAGIAP